MNELRSLPSVDQVLRELGELPVPRRVITEMIRAVLDETRAALLAGSSATANSIVPAVRQRVELLLKPSLRRVINATGIVLHTNLGRAPLPAVETVSGYSNLEYDLEAGKRGKRDIHISRLTDALLGKPAIAVNNNAAAVFLVLNELAAGGEVIVSRGELIEIGDGFRIPEIMTRAGVTLREVGTTNRTHLRDYEEVINANTKLILRVHPSNFHISGFTTRPELNELSNLGERHKVPVYEDLGSGCLVDLKEFGITEPLVSDSFAAGANVVSFSCDKLLGGPQSGLIAGDSALVGRIRRNPLYRALRLDKLAIEALGTALRRTLLEQWSAIPALRMIRTTESELKARAEEVVAELGDVRASVVAAQSPIGGGSTPDQTLPTWLVVLMPGNAARLERALRRTDPPVVARILQDQVVFDMRTVADDEIGDLVQAAQAAFRAVQDS